MLGKGETMKVLITGGAGFIGSSLARKLCADNAEVTVLDNLSPRFMGIIPVLRLRFSHRCRKACTS
ncbi:NAD-dependent epimerase/dehydratase family protein [Paraburkholderia dipogonis]|uniref:NAD-dependent epimerase/dehydratase family protein n=1 Tax=Paraburkholderia dipogonis TaxID=1211383 RepID=UPI003621A7FF